MMRIYKSFSVLTLAFVTLVVFSSCIRNYYYDSISGEGEVVKKELQLEAFNGIKLSLPADVYLTKGNVQKVEVEAQENIIDYIQTEVSDQSWKIRFPEGTSARDFKKIRIYITVPEVRKATISGSGKILGQTSFEGADQLDLRISGSGYIRMEQENTGLVKASISGSGKIELFGTAQSLDFRSSGSGDLLAYELDTEDASISMSGSGKGEVTASKNLKVSISGSGRVRYQGSPRVSTSVSGSGSVKAVDSM
ncbi:head GIN domain-containing protein [Xanthovirga aplysinae]|uniref:head GIN domain-containing protein n=1 Tax=Xanthovirga aplysinae TaxID=2529853 RepID=UPI0012BD7758|nr:head GIN domain-containing protein [Xanthovirga aplysinae]MTI30141.1 DUF2807 domain-containing protein [Xanthovirga aplysinae]